MPCQLLYQIPDHHGLYELVKAEQQSEQIFALHSTLQQLLPHQLHQLQKRSEPGLNLGSSSHRLHSIDGFVTFPLLGSSLSRAVRQYQFASQRCAIEPQYAPATRAVQLHAFGVQTDSVVLVGYEASSLAALRASSKVKLPTYSAFPRTRPSKP